MGVSYQDIQDKHEGQQLLQEKRATDKADELMSAEIVRREEDLQKQEQEVDASHSEMDQQELMSTAKQVVAKMDELTANGEDPMELLAQLPPQVQDAVAMLLQDETVNQQEQPPVMTEDQLMPSPASSMGGQQGGAVQQQPMNVTQQAQGLL